jgi:2-dehydro-3-deoxyphosphogalactonate aldolase
VERGFTAVTSDPARRYFAFDPRQPSLAAIERSVRLGQKVREAVGTRADLLFGTRGQLRIFNRITKSQRLDSADSCKPSRRYIGG